MINGNSLVIQFGKENTYGSLATPEKQIKVASESLKATYNKKDEGLLTSSKSGTGKKETMSVSTSGNISTLFRPDDGLFLACCLGEEATVESVGDNAYKHTFTAIDSGEENHLPSISAFVDRKTDIFTYNGLKIDSLSFDAQPEDYLKMDISFVGGRDEGYNGSINRTLTSSPLKALKFRHGKVTIGSTQIADITSIKFDYSNALDSSVQTTGTGLYYKEASVGGRTIQTQLEMLYNTESENLRRNLYKSDATVGIELVFTSDEEIENGIPYSLKIKIPCNQCADANANFGSADTIKQSMTFDAIEGNTELITVELTNGYSNQY